MNKKFLNYSQKECMWCGDKFDFRPGKKFCCRNCNAFYWINEKKKKHTEPITSQSKTRKKVLGYIKRRKDVIQFADYLNLIKRYNKLYSIHLSCAFKGTNAKYLDVSHKMLKSDTPHKYSRQIDEILAELEKSQ